MPDDSSLPRLAPLADRTWDIVVVGGGITGAGILREASRAGASALLLEQRDFAWGTSSRSSKLVHGGLRYLREAKFRLTWESVKERERLLEEGPGLIEPMTFLLAIYRGDTMGRMSYGTGLAIYDTIAGSWQHQYFDAERFAAITPELEPEGLTGGFRYHDATTDDARLVMRVLREGVKAGGTVASYARVGELLREGDDVAGVTVHDGLEREAPVQVRARVVINATGAWADRLRAQVEARPRMRPLRGSHLLFPPALLPVKAAIAFQHPVDHRAMFVYPWEGASLLGTTDLDHQGALDDEAAITPAEVAYLMAALRLRFPSLNLRSSDAVASYSGVRPVVNTGKKAPSKETRDHVVWSESGLLTVTGGKLTTFRLIAHEALRAARSKLPDMQAVPRDGPLLDAVTSEIGADLPIDEAQRRRLTGRYGADAAALLAQAAPDDLEPIEGTPFLWAELRWAAKREWVTHLEDLLLRRVRVGLLVRGGGRTVFGRVKAICQAELGWDDARWAEEEALYLTLWDTHHRVPDEADIPPYP